MEDIYAYKVVAHFCQSVSSFRSTTVCLHKFCWSGNVLVLAFKGTAQEHPFNVQCWWFLSLPDCFLKSLKDWDRNFLELAALNHPTWELTTGLGPASGLHQSIPQLKAHHAHTNWSNCFLCKEINFEAIFSTSMQLLLQKRQIMLPAVLHLPRYRRLGF